MVNEHGKVLDVSSNVDTENRNVIVYNKHGRINQQWDLIYADEYPDEPTKGQLNKEFNFYVERDFYIQSQLGSQRYLSVIDNKNIVIKTPNGQKYQIWYFDQKTKTVKTRLNNKSFDIVSAGKTRNMQVWATNSGWW
jgi:dipeptidyl aminopeptidase/acylaminoacyl peptidase